MSPVPHILCAGRIGADGITRSVVTWELRVPLSFLPFVRSDRISPNALPLAAWPSHTYGARWFPACDHA